MTRFDINKVVAHFGADTEDLARVLYPSVKYPKLAFDRVLKGETDLDVRQLEKLASHLGVLVSDLFAVDTWSGTTEDGCLTLLKGDYKVKLNYKGVFVSIYKSGELIEQVISNVPEMSIQEFIDYLDNYIKNFENGQL